MNVHIDKRRFRITDIACHSSRTKASMYCDCQKRCHATLTVRPLLLINDNAFVIRDVYDLNAQIPFVSGFIVLNYLYWYRINISTTFNVAFTQYNRYIMYEYAYVQREYMLRGIIFIISSSHYTYTTGRGPPIVYN